MNNKEKIGFLVGVAFLFGIFSWMFTAPYLGNEGLARTPGIIIGGTASPAPEDFTALTPAPPFPLMMKQAGFPPFVIYLSWAATTDGVILQRILMERSGLNAFEIVVVMVCCE